MVSLLRDNLYEIAIWLDTSSIVPFSLVCKEYNSIFTDEGLIKAVSYINSLPTCCTFSDLIRYVKMTPKTLMIEAITHNNIRCYMNCINNGVSINFSATLSSVYGNSRLMLKSMEMGANNPQWCLYYATYYNQVDTVKIILENYGDDIIDKDVKNTLNIAIKYGYEEIISLIIAYIG